LVPWRRPDAADGGVEFAQGRELRRRVAVVVGGVVEVGRVKVEVADLRVGELLD
jgi:hypothetical protein